MTQGINRIDITNNLAITEYVTNTGEYYYSFAVAFNFNLLNWLRQLKTFLKDKPS